MSKAIVKLLDYTEEFNVQEVVIITLKKIIKVLRNQAFADHAIRLIIKADNKFTEYILKNAIVISDKGANVYIYSDSTKEESQDLKKNDKKTNRKLFRLNKSRNRIAKMGITIDEVIKQHISEFDVLLEKLKAREVNNKVKGEE